jgi:branched-chain amino acid transport system permease protein
MSSTTQAVRAGGRAWNATNITGTALLVVVAAWVIWNFVDAPTQVVQVAILGLCNGALYALIALGYTLVYGIIELINFAHGDLFMLGSVFAAVMISDVFGQEHSNPAGWAAFAVTFVLAMTFCGSINVAVDQLAYRRLRKAPKLAPLITAVGVSFIFQNIGILWNGSAPKSRNSVLPGGGLTLGSITVPWTYLFTLGITVPLLILLTFIVQKTRQGKAMRATAQDPDASRLMGINTNRTIAFTFALGGAMAGAAAIMYLQTNGTTRYDAGFQLGLIAFTAAVLGGVGNLTGAVLGGLLIGLIQGLNDGAPHGLGQEWSQSVVFTILIMLMVFRPAGILGSQTMEKV